MDAPLYPPASAFEQPRLLPQNLSIRTSAIADLQKDPEAMIVLKQMLPSMTTPREGAIAILIEPLSLRDASIPGRLEVVARKSGRIIARKALATTGSPARLHAAVEARHGSPDRQTLLFVPIAVQDSAGRTVPDARVGIALQVSGPAELVALGSANPKNTRSLQASETETFRGRVLAILRSTGASGVVRISIDSTGLAGATITAGLPD